MVIRRKRNKATIAVVEARQRQLEAFLEDARTFTGVSPDDVPGIRMRATEGERVFLCIRGAFLFETPLDLTDPDDLRQRHAPVPVDRGELAVTDRRAVFTGSKQIRQWAWPSLIGVSHAGTGPWTTIDVSNRRRQFGLLYDDENQDQIRFSLDLAVATARGTRDELVDWLESELAAAVSDTPRVGTMSATGEPPDEKVSHDE